MAVGLVMTMNVTVMAETSAQLIKKKTDIDNQISQLQNQNDDKLKAVEKMEIDIQGLDVKIEGLMGKIDQNKKDLVICQNNITKAQKDVEDAEKAVKEQQKLLDERMRAIYKNGSNGYLSVILEAKGFTDLVSRIEAVNKMVAFDKAAIQEMDSQKNDLKKKKQELDDEKIRIEKIKSENEAQKTDLDKTKKEQKNLINKNKSQIADFESQLADLTIKSTVLGVKIKDKQKEEKDEEDRKNAPPSTPSKPTGGTPSRGESGNFSNDEIVQYALTFIGIPYEWGGNGPKTFDCSGFVKYVYAHFGINIPRTTYTQINYGTAVSRDNIQPGDLILFGTPGDPHHVGMYVGNNSYIHAPQTGDFVKVSVLTRTDILSIRRVR